MSRLLHSFLQPPVDSPATTIVLRLMAGSVFLWEGLIKFYFRKPGTGRFAKLGFPAPNLIATSTAWLEIIGGIFLIVGLLSRPVALLFVIEMLVAMLSTKIPLLRETYPLALPSSPPQIGVWAVLHEIRSEYAQLVCSLFVFLSGPGRWSIDAWMARKSKLTTHTRGTLSHPPLFS